ncbi:class I adenylate-forming enzyme family protein [Spirillospora sp. NPDC048823]|uniref:class I adenylate-forming enzyme family protein n=1 Tax=unclassified Spirillospora TaxID=2642701 RepID=UPI00371C4D5C
MSRPWHRDPRHIPVERRRSMFPGILRQSATSYGGKIAATFEGQSLTYKQLYERSCRLANGLLSLGLRKGDKVATLEDNHLDGLVEICALALAGLVRCPMSAQNSADVHAYTMNLVGAKALIVQQKYHQAASEMSHAVETLQHVIVHGGAGSGMRTYEELLEFPADAPDIPVGLEDDHIIRFSAGTTGRPKGILHTVRAWRDMGAEMRLIMPGLDTDDVYLCAGPMGHAAGLLVWPLIAGGARQVIMPAFDPGHFLALTESESCTFTVLVPTMIQMIARHPDSQRRDLSSLRAVFYGAAPITERTLQEAQAVWGYIMYQIYGQSESMPITVLQPRHHILEGSDKERRLLRSAGRPTPNSVVKIIDDNGEEAPPGALGEVCALSPGNMTELWGDPDGTAERITPDGYVRTRDVGYLDADGFLFLADRKEDMIISGGYNIWPAEIENALSAHPDVMEAAVLGVPDDKWGEAVAAVVVLRDGQHIEADELIDWCRKLVGSIKKPKRIEFSAEPLPKNPVGKLVRRTIRDSYWPEEGPR